MHVRRRAGAALGDASQLERPVTAITWIALGQVAVIAFLLMLLVLAMRRARASERLLLNERIEVAVLREQCTHLTQQQRQLEDDMARGFPN